MLLGTHMSCLLDGNQPSVEPLLLRKSLHALSNSRSVAEVCR